MASAIPSFDGTLVGMEVVTSAEQDRRLAEPAYPPMVGISEVADILGVTRQRVNDLQVPPKVPGSRPTIPLPLQTLATGPIWPREWINDFNASWERRSGRPPKAKAS